MRPLAFLFFLALAPPALAGPGADPQPPPIEVPASVSGEVGEFIVVKATTEGKVVRWVVLNVGKGLSVLPSELVPDSKVFVAVGKVPGSYKLIAYTAVGDSPSFPAICTVEVKGADPGPGPTPPGPTPPGPTPPTPVPGGMRVLVVYETADLARMTAAQQQVLFSKTVRDYLNGKCPIGPDGKTREWRMWDQNVDASGESAVWQALLKRPRASVPWVVIATDKGGYEGPLPGNQADMMALLQKYGGA